MIIYDGKVDFDYQDTGHRYTVKKKVGEAWTIAEPVVGTTTVTGVIAKPSLMLWPMNEALNYLQMSMGDIKKGSFMVEKDIRQLLKEAAQAHKKKSQYGKDAGKVGHGMVEALLLGKEPEKPSDDLLEAYTSIKTAFEKYREDFAPEPLYHEWEEEIDGGYAERKAMLAEYPMYSLAHNFAGTIDDVSTIGGKVTISDYKTTNPSYYNPDGIYAENFAQLGAYAILVEEMLELEVEEAQIVNLPKDGSDYKIKSLSDMGLTITDAKLYFLHALGLYNIHGLIGGRLK